MSIAKNGLKGVIVHDSSRAHEGYTLVAPEGGYNVWLINMKGEVVFHWPLEYQPAFFARLLPNGNLLYLGGEEENPQGPQIKIKDPQGNIVFDLVMGGSEYLKELDDDYNIVWEHRDPYMSHDFFRMDNGNTMVIKYVLVPEELKNKIKGGIHVDPKAPMWCDMLVEITPDKKVAWEWKSYEHLDLDNDIYCPLMQRYEWTHMNSCTVLPDGDVLGSFRTLDIICRIDRKTGKIIWKWGQNELAHQHEPTMVDNGNIIVFDNGEHRKFTKYAYSRVVEVNPKTNKIEWEYKADPPFSFYSGNQSGCQRLANGNTLITDTMPGRIFEVTRAGEIVWEFMSPFYGPHAGQSANPMVYRAYRYSPDYPGLKGKDLNPERYKAINDIFGPAGLGIYRG